MEADLIELFEIFRTILEQCREVVIVEADLDICKRLQTKIGISLTMMKQIDFGDVVVQTFMSDLDFFSTIMEATLESFRAPALPSLEVLQEYRCSMVQAVVKLIASTKEFYLTKVEYVASDVAALPVSSRVYDLEDSDTTAASFDAPALTNNKPRAYRLEEDAVIALPKYRSNTVFGEEAGVPSALRKTERERELESLHLNDMPRNFGKYGAAGGWSKARHKVSTPDAKALPKPTAMALSEDMQAALKAERAERIERMEAAPLRRGTIFDQDDHMIIQRITQLNLRSTAAKKISANAFLLDGLDEQQEKETHLGLASQNDKKLQALRKSHSFSIRNRKKYINYSKRLKRTSCPSLSDLKAADRTHSHAKRPDRRITVTTNPTTGRTYKRYALDSDNVQQQLGIVIDKQRAHTLVNEQRGYGLMPSRSTTAMMNYARDPEVKNVTQILSKSVSKQNLIQERNLCEQAEAAYKKLLDISAAFSEKNASFPDIRASSRVYVREAFVYISPFAKERKQFHMVLCNDLLLLMECVKPHYGLGIQIRINDWNVKSMPVERKRDEESFPCAIVSQKLKKIYRIYFDNSVVRSQWIVDLLSAISGGFDHLAMDKQHPSKPFAVKKDSPLLDSDGKPKLTKLTYDAGLDEKKLFTNFMVAGVIGALNDIPRDMFVVFLLTGEKKTVPCVPTQCIRQTIEKIARHFALDMNECTVYTESGESISLDKKFSEIPGRSVVLASNVLLKTMYTSFSFQRKGVGSQSQMETKRKGLIRKVSFKEKGSITSSQKNAASSQNRASASLKPSLSAPDLITTRGTRSTSSPTVPSPRQSVDEESQPAPLKSPRSASLATNPTHSIATPNNANPTHNFAAPNSTNPTPMARPPVTHAGNSSATTPPLSANPSPIANSVNSIKRSARSISLGLNRVEQINKAAQATALANEGLAKGGASKVDSRANSRPGSPRDVVIPPLAIPTHEQRVALAQGQGQGPDRHDDSEDSAEMYRSYAMANIDISMLYASPIQIKKDAELFAQDLLSPRGTGIDTSDFFGEDCYGVVSWKDSHEKVKLHYDEDLQRALDRERERVAHAPAPVTSVLTTALRDDDAASNNKSSMAKHGALN